MFSIFLRLKQNYHVTTKFLLITLLAALCWLAAISQLLIQIFSPCTSAHATTTYRLHPVNQQTYQVIPQGNYSSIDSLCSVIVKDPQLQSIYSHSTPQYKDYYFYSPSLRTPHCNTAVTITDTDTHTQTCYNVHVAVTKNGQIYIGFPHIQYDF